MAYVAIDSGFLIALFDNKDNYHRKAEDILIKLIDFRERQLIKSLIILWPIMYEVVNTRLVRNSTNFQRLLDFLNSFGIEFVDDSKYRRKAFDNIRSGKKISFTDHVIQLFLSEKRGIDYFITFNHRDFPQERWSKKYRIRVIYSAQDFSWSSHV